MRRLILGLSMAILVMAKPELYREKEDFQYSRSSSDQGSKSGYYDAQRGNMGGNYERAHNMDTLAQHQMGGLVKQVEGELGDGSKTRTGSVFTAANSQGIYGSGRYDLSNVAGRNFQEGVTYHDSQSHLSAGSQAHTSQYSALNNARYNTDSLSHSSGFGGFHQADNLQEAQNSYGATEYEHGSHSQRSSKYHVQSGYQGSSDYERSNAHHQASNNFGADTHNRMIVSQVPVRIVVRPGTRVAIPLATETHSGSHATSYDQSNVNSEAEVLNSGVQQAAFRPSSDAKHYESSYSYRKEWEKHHTKPVAVPLDASVLPISKNSELYDEGLQHGYTQNAGYNLASSHSRQQAGFNTQHSALSSENQHEADYNARQHTSSSNINSNAYLHSGYNSLANSHSDDLTGAFTSKPKSYHSSYSYHKSWERQGDPYVIQPSSNGAYDGQASQRLTDFSGAQGEYSSHNYGSRKSHQTYSVKDCVIECDPNSHIRVARSYGSEPHHFKEQNRNTNDDQELSQSVSDWGQQTQTSWGNLEQSGQQTQNNWNQLNQDVGQQVQDKWENLEDLGQQTHSTWDQQAQNTGQEIQNNWDDLGQQTQNNWNPLNQDVGQHEKNKWEKLEDPGQQTQNTWEQQAQNTGQEIQNKWDDLGQQTQSLSEDKNTGQAFANGWNNLEAFGQQSEKGQDQQTQDYWETQKQDTQKGVTKPVEVEDLGQHNQAQWNQFDKHEHDVTYYNTQQSEHGKFDTQAFDSQDALGWWPSHKAPEQSPQTVDLFQQTHGFDFDQSQSVGTQDVFEQNNSYRKQKHGFQEEEDLSQQTQGVWSHLENQHSFNHDQPFSENSESGKSRTTTQRPRNTSSLNSLWGKIDNLDDDFVPSFSTSQTQNTDYIQTSSFDSIAGKPDDLDADTVPSSVIITHQTQNTDFTQDSSQSAYYNWNQERLFSNSTSSNNAEVTDYTGFLLNEKSDNTHQLAHTVEDIIKKTTTENYLTVTNGKLMTTTSQKPQEGKTQTSDFGRGDIGPDETEIDLSTSTTQRTSRYNKYASVRHEHRTENNNKQQYESQNENKAAGDEKNSDFQDEDINEQQSEIKHAFNKESEQYSHKTFTEKTGRSNEDDLKYYNKPDKRVVTVEVTEKIDHHFGTHDFQQNEQPFDYFEQKPVKNVADVETPEQIDQLETQHLQQNFNNFERKPDKHVVDVEIPKQIDQLETQHFEQNFDNFEQKPDKHVRNDQVSKQREKVDSLPDFRQQNFKSQFEVIPVIGTYNFQQNKQQFDYFEQKPDKNFVDVETPEQTEQLETQNFQQNFDNFEQKPEQRVVDVEIPEQIDQLETQQFQQNFDHFEQKPDKHVRHEENQKKGPNQIEKVDSLSDFRQQNVKSEFEVIPVIEQQEEMVKYDSVESLVQQPSTNNFVKEIKTITPTPITEKPGFWKVVGNKLTTAKKRVASWFQKSSS